MDEEKIAVMEERLKDWFLNVWDELGSETSREDIIDEFTEIVGNKEVATKLVEAWFVDHAGLLQAWTRNSNAGLSLIAYEHAIEVWLQNQLENLLDKS